MLFYSYFKTLVGKEVNRAIACQASFRLWEQQTQLAELVIMKYLMYRSMWSSGLPLTVATPFYCR